MQNVETKKKLKVCTLLLTLLLPLSALAQGGLLMRGEEPDQNFGLHRNGSVALFTNQAFGNPINGSIVTNQTFGNTTGGVDVTNQTFGASLGSGIFTLLLTGVGYAALKSNKRNNKSKKENIK